MDLYQRLQEKLGPKVLSREPLARHTTFRIGGSAQFYYEAATTNKLVRAARIAKALNIPYYILGGGSNLLVSDEGVAGLVVKIQNSKIKIQNTSVKAEAGVKLAYLAWETVKQGLSGLEFAVAIPGTVGGGISGNAGFPNIPRGCLGEWVKDVTVLRDGEIMKLPQKDCGFGYRDSIFKRTKDIILELELLLVKGAQEKSQKLINDYFEKRKVSQPLGLPSAGSIFKNPPGEIAGQLIEKAGFKGQKMGGAMVSAKHANFIVNTGGAKAQDVLDLINLIKKEVKGKFGIELEEEIQYWGF